MQPMLVDDPGTEYLEVAPQGEREDFPVRVVDAGGRQRTFGYDALGGLATSTDLGGATWIFERPDPTRELVKAPTGEILHEDVLAGDGKLVERRHADGGSTRYTLERLVRLGALARMAQFRMTLSVASF